MSWADDYNRRRFLGVSGGAALMASFGSFSFEARAELAPSAIRIGHITDTRFTEADDSSRSGKVRPGWLFGHAFSLADDLLDQFGEVSSEAVKLVLHSGNLIHSADRIRGPGQAQAAREWLEGSPIPVRLSRGGSDTRRGGFGRQRFLSTFADHGFFEGHGYYSYELDGFHFIHLDAGNSTPPGSASRLHDRSRQLDWLADDLARDRELPTVLVMHPPLLAAGPDPDRGLARADRRALIKLIRSHPQVLLVLGGKTLCNRAGFIAETTTLCLVTASPVFYPCGGRWIELAVKGNRSVIIRSNFLQSRRLELVEKSFHQASKSSLMARLGSRVDRSSSARGGALERSRLAINPSLAPWWKGEESVTLAVMADTHLCLDEFISEELAEDYELVGHFTEAGSKALYSDILGQLAEGRHRVEFYDEIFSRSPEADAHFLELSVDALLLCGDLVENGRRAEAEVVRAGLSRLPASLRERTLVAIGNHDLYRGEFSLEGSASSRKPIADFYAGFGCASGATHYVAPLTEWLTLIVLDSTIANFDHLGLIQEQIDWLEDQIEQRRDQVVIIASHHPLYHLGLVPGLLQVYLQTRYKFTPRLCAARVQLQKLFARHHNVKMVISGHYHGVCVEQHKKKARAGTAADDPFTTIVQVPCTIEYPCGYRLFKISREQGRVRIEYVTAYTRLAELRRLSSQAPLYRILGTKIKPPGRFKESLARLSRQDNISGEFAVLNPFDVMDLNCRGAKDGTTNRGRGNTGKPNQNGKLECSI